MIVFQFPKEWLSGMFNILVVSIFGEDHLPNLCLDSEHPEVKITVRYLFYAYKFWLLSSSV